MSTEGDALIEALVQRLGQGSPANIALMHLLMAAASPGAAETALGRAGALHPGLADGIAAVAALAAAHPGAWAAVHAVADSVDHAPTLPSTAAALAYWRDSFDRLAESAPEAGVALYALGDAALLARSTGEVVEALDAWGLLGPERDALDLGCGIGRFAEALAPRMRTVLGLDLSAAMVEEARRRNRHGNVRFLVGSGHDLAGVDTAGFDLVLAADVFPYLVEAGLADRHFGEMARVLRQGGAAVILNYSYRGDPARDQGDVAAAARRHGFSVARAGPGLWRLWDAAAFHVVKAG